MGSEDTGISNAILSLADEKLKIPILGNIESLNVSVSAALIIYEAVRQRNYSKT
jgi:23S rRNA (guanosine2251-2'-O)-methyltransferase